MNVRDVLRRLGYLDREGRLTLRVGMLITCPHLYVYRYSETTFTMERGEIQHRRLQKLLAPLGFEAEHEIVLERERWRIVGHIDLYHPGERVIGEIKYTEDPWEKTLYQAQSMSYAALHKAVYGEPPSKVYIISVRRPIPPDASLEDISRCRVEPRRLECFDAEYVLVKPFEFEEARLSKVLDELLSRASLVYQAVQKSWIPRFPYEYCKYCPYRTTCNAYRDASRARNLLDAVRRFKPLFQSE